MGFGVLFGGHIEGRVNVVLWHKIGRLTFIHVLVLIYLAPRPKEPNGLGPVAQVLH